MKIGTEENISEPQAPNILTDISSDLAAISAAIAAALAGIPTPPSIPMGGAFSLDALLNALVNTAVFGRRPRKQCSRRHRASSPGCSGGF